MISYDDSNAISGRCTSFSFAKTAGIFQKIEVYLQLILLATAFQPTFSNAMSGPSSWKVLFVKSFCGSAAWGNILNASKYARVSHSSEIISSVGHGCAGGWFRLHMMTMMLKMTALLVHSYVLAHCQLFSCRAILSALMSAFIHQSSAPAISNYGYIMTAYPQGLDMQGGQNFKETISNTLLMTDSTEFVYFLSSEIEHV